MNGTNRCNNDNSLAQHWPRELRNMPLVYLRIHFLYRMRWVNSFLKGAATTVSMLFLSQRLARQEFVRHMPKTPCDQAVD